jgi:hypothetical protein
MQLSSPFSVHNSMQICSVSLHPPQVWGNPCFVLLGQIYLLCCRLTGPGRKSINQFTYPPNRLPTHGKPIRSREVAKLTTIDPQCQCLGDEDRDLAMLCYFRHLSQSAEAGWCESCVCPIRVPGYVPLATFTMQTRSCATHRIFYSFNPTQE